jgi:hypothetical protein
MKRNLLYFISFIIVLTLVACSLDTTQSVPLTKREIEKLAADERINVKSYKEIGAMFTFIMFDGGFYTAYKQDGEIRSRPVRYGSSNKNPVTTAGVSTGFPFVTISINDKNLLRKTDKIKVVWEDGKESIQTVNDRSALIIPYDNNINNVKKSYNKIYLLDEKGNVIFRQP